MQTSSLRRKVLGLVLGAALVTSPAWAASPRASEKADLFSPLDFLSRLWNGLAHAWNETGCYIDPDGGCVNTEPEEPPADQVDTGCYIDPNGGCANAQPVEPPSNEVDEGCYIDPSGGCGA